MTAIKQERKRKRMCVFHYVYRMLLVVCWSVYSPVGSGCSPAYLAVSTP